MSKAIVVFIALAFSSLSVSAANLSGYYSFERVDAESSEPAWDAHNVNLIVSHETGAFRFFSEIEFEKAVKMEGTGECTALPCEGTGRGEIVMERAWGEYSYNKYLNVRLGLFLDDTYYQQHHYPNVVPNFSRPQLVTNIIDGDIEGLKLHGEIAAGLSYVAELGQDPGSTDNTHTMVGVHYKKEVGDLDLSLAVRTHQYEVAGENEDALSYEVIVHYQNFLLWFEGANRSIETGDKEGMYAILAYSFLFDNHEFSPFISWDTYKDKAAQTDSRDRIGYGISYRPEPNIAIKLEQLDTQEFDNVDKTSQWGFQFAYFFN